MANAPVSESKQESPKQAESFAKQAEEASPGLVAEFWDFLIHNKKWWLTPIVLVLLVFALLVVLGGTAIGPFMYTVF